MAKLVDALPSGGSVRKDVQVRILFWAPDCIGSRFWEPIFFRVCQVESRLASGFRAQNDFFINGVFFVSANTLVTVLW